MYSACQVNFFLFQDILNSLTSFGHKVQLLDGFAVVSPVSRAKNGTLYAMSDPRKCISCVDGI